MARVTRRPSWWQSRNVPSTEVRTGAVTLVTGATSRTKVLDVDIDDAEGHRRWVALLDS